MTDHSERDEAAKYYEYKIGPRLYGRPITIEAFKAGADWAVKNDPRVLKLVEALGLASVYARSERPDDVIQECVQALTEWSKP